MPRFATGRNARYGSATGINSCPQGFPGCATSGLMHRSKKKQWSRLYRRLAAFGRICAFRRPAAVAPKEVARILAAWAFARYFNSGEYSRSD
jgi:hypothetical protein